MSYKSEFDEINDEIDKLIDKINDEYDEDFFVDNALVVCMFTWGYLSPNLTIDSVLVLNNELIINIINREKKWTLHLTMAEFWVCVIEVSQNNLDGVDKVNVTFETKRYII